MRPANTETYDGAPSLTAFVINSTWAVVKPAVTFTFNPTLRELTGRRRHRLTCGGGNGNLDVDVLPPTSDHARLAAHLGDVVGEHLERDRMRSDPLQEPLGELLDCPSSLKS
jgi:hypothetical protein